MKRNKFKLRNTYFIACIFAFILTSCIGFVTITSIATPSTISMDEVKLIHNSTSTFTKNDISLELPLILPVEGRISSKYGMRKHPINNTKSFHGGIDIAVIAGSKIRVTGKGVVILAGIDSGYGQYILIKHPNVGYYTFYGHLSKIIVMVGQQVDRGNVIALSGDSGFSTGQHLHYELRNSNGKKINPLTFIP